MPEAGEVGAGSFEFYEGIRIVLPGALVVGLAAAIAKTFNFSTPSLSESTAGAAVVAVLVGMVIYYIDIPAQSAAFRDLLPSDLMESWGYVGQGKSSLLNVYFLALDEMMPAGVRARALYMGSIFRVGYESIYLLLLTGNTVLAVSCIRTARNPHNWATHQPPISVFVAGVLLCLASIPLSAELEDRREKQRRQLPDESRSTNERASGLVQINWQDGLQLTFSIGLMLLAITLPHRHSPAQLILGSLACLTSSLWWVVRYHRGYPPKTGSARRIKIDREAAVALGATAVAITDTWSAAMLPGRSAISSMASLGWVAISLIAVSLINSRGHEKRLRGSYSTQNAWLEQHKDEVIAKYALIPGSRPAQNPRRKRFIRTRRFLDRMRQPRPPVV